MEAARTLPPSTSPTSTRRTTSTATSTNYHVWETLVRWDSPETYGIACKRVDARDPATMSAFNRKRQATPWPP